MTSKKENLEITPLLCCKNYTAVIKNSAGSRMFRHIYAKVNGKEKDLLRNGDLSCAFFASTILYWFQLIKKPHATVSGTIKDMEKSGWREIKNPRPGSVLIWEPKEFDEGGVKASYLHMGFYIGNNKAVSNSTKIGMPKIHHWTYGAKKGNPARKIEAVFWHKKLEG